MASGPMFWRRSTVSSEGISRWVDTGLRLEALPEVTQTQTRVLSASTASTVISDITQPSTTSSNSLSGTAVSSSTATNTEQSRIDYIFANNRSDATNNEIQDWLCVRSSYFPVIAERNGSLIGPELNNEASGNVELNVSLGIPIFPLHYKNLVFFQLGHSLDCFLDSIEIEQGLEIYLRTERRMRYLLQ